MSSQFTYRKRLYYFFILAIVFIIGVPFLVLYATGYRFGEELELEKRGGIYVTVPQSGASIFIDWMQYHTTAFLSHDYLKQDAVVGDHEVEVRHPDYKTWYREVEVKPQTVTPLYPFLVPLEYEIRTLYSTSTLSELPLEEREGVTFDEYERIMTLFEVTETATSTRKVRSLNTLLSDAVVATTTPELATPDDILPYHQITKDDITVWYDGYTIYAYWDNEDWLPERFCNKHSCVNPMAVLTTSQRITHVDFYPGRDDVILYTLPDGIYVAEIDKRPWPVREQILYGRGIDFRIENNNLYVKEGNRIVELE